MAKAKKRVVKAKKKPSKKMTSMSKKKVVKKTAAKRKSKKVSAVPKGFHTVTPYLIIRNAAKAIEFYQKVLGAKLVMKMEHGPGKIGHAELNVGDSKIMLADEFPEMGYQGPEAFGGSSVTLHLYVKKVDEIFERAISAGSKVIRQVQDMFYGDRMGVFQDPYGHQWSVSTHFEDVSMAQLKKRAAESGKCSG